MTTTPAQDGLTATEAPPRPDVVDVDAYLARIGAERPARPDYEALCRLQERHLMTVPFETLDFTLGEVPSMRDTDVLDKIVNRRRGGGCGELNSAFALLLRALGYRVTLLGGRVLHNGKHYFRGVHNGHMVLRVELEETYLVDVGFRWASRRPLRLRERGVQTDPHGEYRLVHTPDGDVEMVHDGVTRWRIEMHPRDLDDFNAVLWYCATSPDMPGAGQLWASIVTPDGRVSMFNRVLTEYTDGVRTDYRTLTDDDEFLREFENRYGIRLEKVPDLAPVTEGV
ncbi:arylamine N-acetyltransferase family protein [Streptomyces aidingensis]|uniref:N-hydroxyarylamine O-acetyltransferase n=1 Tax=Streptomyces aidingensis TaxID=910347 RepID=A0A1I1FHQ7_9ACTN|nr:arylamine N-acetyltransferase [Streptomyces aidingensis]SFB98486.1 N-hydroxyarylamine O-acetyltransferase [Streptomyces aidingensis]